MLRVLAGNFLSGPGGSVLKLLVPREEKNLKLLMAETRLRQHVPRYHGTVDKDGASILPSFLPATNPGVEDSKTNNMLRVFLAANHPSIAGSERQLLLYAKHQKSGSKPSEAPLRLDS